MTLYSKSLELKDFKINPDVSYFVPKKGIEVKWQEKEGSIFATLIANKRKILQQQANELPVLSDRARTLKNLPKMRIINNHKVRIN